MQSVLELGGLERAKPTLSGLNFLWDRDSEKLKTGGGAASADAEELVKSD